MHFVFMMLLLFRGSFYRLVSSDLDTLTVGGRCTKAMAADVDHFNSSSVSTCAACWCRMGGMGLVEWVLGCNEPAALTHNVTPERERVSTECMYFLPLPPGGRSVNASFDLWHVVRCVCPLLFHLCMSVLLLVSSYIVF